MTEKKVVRTDTSTLVLFDPEMLACREVDESDWWTGDEDLLREEARQGLTFVDTGSDGLYEVTITDELPAGHDLPVKTSVLGVPSGKLLFGAGEFLPGDGPPIVRFLGEGVVDAGVCDVQVLSLQPAGHGVPAYGFVLAKRRTA